MAQSTISRLLSASPQERFRLYAGLDREERYALYGLLSSRLENKWTVYGDDPVRFVQDGLGETIWSKQREILESVRDNKRTVVPACHAPGKSHIAARAVAWWVTVHPPGTALAVTTATTFRQVRNILWPHIRRVVDRHGLPGGTSQVEWRIGNELAAFGFSSGDQDETAVQGVHAPHLLVVVDEAGGVSDTMGRSLEALMTGAHTRMLVLGNPPTDQEDSWFERACSSPLYNVIRIGAYDTPNFTGEDAGMCHSCVGTDPHPVNVHLVDREWVEDVISEFGEDSAFTEARVHAKFPRSHLNKVIPYSWAEQAVENEEPLAGENIRLGVDVASDGGDEFVIAWADGYQVRLEHRSSGSTNQNSMDVAGVLLRVIQRAEAVHQQKGISEPVRVKIDALGVGWGVVSTLQRWGDEGRHQAQIIGVKVSERARESGRFTNQRAELWWTGRHLLQPQGGKQDVRLNVDRTTLAQLAGPMFKTDSHGRIAIEKKTDMKRRGVNSPDRAEAVLLAFFEPPGYDLWNVAPMSFTQSNQFDLGGLTAL
jgi:hypothetical protein